MWIKYREVYVHTHRRKQVKRIKKCFRPFTSLKERQGLFQFTILYLFCFKQKIKVLSKEWSKDRPTTKLCLTYLKWVSEVPLANFTGLIWMERSLQQNTGIKTISYVINIYMNGKQVEKFPIAGQHTCQTCLHLSDKEISENK